MVVVVVSIPLAVAVVVTVMVCASSLIFRYYSNARTIFYQPSQNQAAN